MAEAEDIPFYLMPVAAVLAMYALMGGIRAFYLVYANITYKQDDDTTVAPPPPLKTRSFVLLVISVLGAIFGYAKVVANIENAMMEHDHALFDPFEILNIASNANSTVVKKAYRHLSKLHHPDKGGSEALFYKINLAYRALSDEVGRKNWELHGHPDGPVRSKSLDFALPPWLLHPEGNVALIMVLLYFGMFAALIYFVIAWATRTQQQAHEEAKENSVAGPDVEYLAAKLLPDTTHLELLVWIATTPENIERSEKSLSKIKELKDARIAKQKKQASASTSMDFDAIVNDDGGWAEDDDEEGETAKKEVESQKEKEQRIAKATGSEEVLMEGIDEGVLGQAWVERTLAKKQQWPPPPDMLKAIQDMTFGKENLKAMDHPAVRRNLCMTMGRLNAQYLNSHQELLHAGANKLVDQTYFKSSIEYRQRCGMLLEACLRIAITNRSYRLAKTVVETVAMFKVGVTSPTDKQNIQTFQDAMRKQYGGNKGVPRMVVKSYTLATEDEDEIATGDLCSVELEMERTHAENFTKQKIAICKKQGIPHQVALTAYREGWWIMVREERMDGPNVAEEEKPTREGRPFAALLEANAAVFQNEVGQDRLITAWPLIVQNVAQVGGKAKVQFRAPKVPGKYKFIVAIKSQEFLGADQEFEVEKEVVDVETLNRPEKEEEDDEDDETKKEK